MSKAQDVFDIADKLNKTDFNNLFNNYKNKLSEDRYYNEKVKFTDTGINCFAVRCNEIGVANDVNRNNDALIVVTPETTLFLHITCDPKTKKNGIAFILPCQWKGNIREHHYTAGRLAICQDFDKTWVRRFHGDSFEDYNGFFTIHVHDSNGLHNTSLGCLILDSDKSYKELFKPELVKQNKKDSRDITVSVMDYDTFIELTAQATAVNGTDVENAGAKGGTASENL